jgi:hypothetical protein
MKIYSIYDKDFEKYGRVIDGDFTEIIEKLKSTPRPDDKTTYCPSCKELECTLLKGEFEAEVYAGMPIQIGYCNGFNKNLNALEYHKGSEINVAENDVLLILGTTFEIKDGKFDTADAKAFLLPAGKAVEMFATTLHYAPYSYNQDPFRVVIVLPKYTNYARPNGAKDPLIWATNKWLLCREGSPESEKGAYVGLIGEKVNL